MTDVDNWVWIFDEVSMVCRCKESNVIVRIEKTTNGYEGKILDMPIELFSEISKIENGERIIERIVRQAKKEAIKAIGKNR